MNGCKRCLKMFSEDEYSNDNPTADLGKLYLDSIGTINGDDLCPECREDLGISQYDGIQSVRKTM